MQGQTCTSGCIDASQPHDHVGHENLAAHWDKLSEEEQVRLNDLAEKQDAELRSAGHEPVM